MPVITQTKNHSHVSDHNLSAADKSDWRQRAACLDENPELFFPIGDTEPAEHQLHQAKQVCDRCPVRDACLECVLKLGSEHGVWGGLSPAERKALTRRMTRSRRPVA